MPPADDWTDDCDFDFDSTSDALDTGGSRHTSFASARQASSTAYLSAVETLSEIEEFKDVDDLEVGHEKPLRLDARLRKVVEERQDGMVEVEPDWDQPITPLSLASPRVRDDIGSGEVLTTMPGGRAFVTRLGGSRQSSPPLRSTGRSTEALETEQTPWEQDADFPMMLRLNTRKEMPNTRKEMPEEDELDWDLEEDDERESTLKAGAATLKGLKLPQKFNTDTIRPGRMSLSSQSRYSEDNEENKPDEDSFDLPIGVSRIKLASATTRADASPQHHSSLSSLTSTNDGAHPPNTSTSGWDSPGSLLPSHSRRVGNSTFATSPSSSSTSVTSFSMLGTDNSEIDDRGVRVADQEDEDMEQGLLLPNPTFFSSGRVQELNSLLDRRRKPQALTANHPPISAINHRSTSGNSRTSSSDFSRPTMASASRARISERREESFEDGLVLDDAATELNQGRLSRLRRIRASKSRTSDVNRTIRVTGSVLQRNVLSVSGSTRGFISLEEMARIATQAGSSSKPWSPVPTGTRTTSAQTSGFVAESPSRASSRAAEVRSVTNPSPSHASTTSLAAYTPSRLRHQKSHSRLQQPPPSPSLGRKQSLQSLQDAMANQTSNLRPRLVGEPGRVVAPSYEGQTAASVARAHRRDRDHDAPPPAPSTGSAGRVSGLSEQAVIDRLTMPTSSSRAKARPAISSIFATSSPPAASHVSLSPTLPTQLLRRPKKPRSYGDGTELDAFDDLQVDRQKEGTMKVTNIRPTSRSKEAAASVTGASYVQSRSSSSLEHHTPAIGDKRKKSTSSHRSKTSSAQPRRAPALIRKLGGDGDKQKTIGDMTWNPLTQRWEGNYAVLRDFENEATKSARPALIAHYASNSTTAMASPGGVTQSASSVHIVGDMRFDSEKMCWISILPPEDDEPDPFEGMADNESDSFDKGVTLTRTTAKVLGKNNPLSNVSRRIASESTGSVSTSVDDDYVLADRQRHSPPQLVSDALWQQCLAAQTRHKEEMRGWVLRTSPDTAEMAERKKRDEKRLWEIRNLALRSSL